MKTVLIHYFTGTGNTYHAVKLLGDTLSNSGYRTEYRNMEKDQNRLMTTSDLHIFAFPVYGFGMPTIAKKYLKRLTRISSAKACILSIGGQTGHSTGVLDNAFEGDALLTASRLLQKKGFHVQITELLGYPENWTQFFNPPDDETQTKINDSQDQILFELAEKILSNQDSLRIPPTLPYTLGKVTNWAYSSVGRRILGKLFISDEKCNHCGKCSRICPVHNIEMSQNIPQWQWHCEGCQRCINACPVDSIQTSTVRLITLLSMQFAPIYLVISLNKRISIHFALDILLYAFIALLLTAAADHVLKLLERFPPTKKIIQRNFTHKFRRYLSKDIHF